MHLSNMCVKYQSLHPRQSLHATLGIAWIEVPVNVRFNLGKIRNHLINVIIAWLANENTSRFKSLTTSLTFTLQDLHIYIVNHVLIL